MLGDILIIIAITLAAAVFVAAEIALVSLRDSQVKRLAASRGKRGRTLQRLVADPNRFLASVQVGVTVLGFLSAALGAERLGRYLTPIFEGWGWPAGLAGVVSLIVVTLGVAYVSLVLGELTPKRLALQRSEGIAMAVAPLIDWISKVLRPVIWLLSKSTDIVVRIVGGDPDAAKEEMTGDELRGIVASSESLSGDERQLIGDVLDAGERALRDVMLPRTQVAFLDARMTASKAIAEARTSPHSRYPVIDSSPDDVIGFVHIRDLLLPAGPVDRTLTVRDLARDVVRLPGSKKVLAAMSEMRRGGYHLAIVVDEYGGTDGIVTLEDLIEEIIGDIRDEYDEDDAVPHRLAGGEFSVDGRTNLWEFTELTGIELPEGPYETVGGFMMAALGRIPQVGDEVAVDTLRHSGSLTVTELDGRRASRVLVTAVVKHDDEDERDEDETGATAPSAAATAQKGTT